MPRTGCWRREGGRSISCATGSASKGYARAEKEDVSRKGAKVAKTSSRRKPHCVCGDRFAGGAGQRCDGRYAVHGGLCVAARGRARRHGGGGVPRSVSGKPEGDCFLPAGDSGERICALRQTGRRVQG